MQTYREALAAIELDSSNAGVVCEKLEDTQLQADCLIAGAESMADLHPTEAADLCDRISPTMNQGVSRDECLFQVAERSKEPARCSKAGSFADPCRMHLWGSHVPSLQGSTWKEKETAAQSSIGHYGLQDTDTRPWIALYRWLLSHQHPLSRHECATAIHTDACMEAGVSLVQDRLNRLTDLQQLPCTPDEPLPSLLQVTDDENLSKMITKRQEIVCR